MLTDKQVKVIGDALLVRADEWERGCELWLAIEAEYLPSAHELHERGYLSRRWDRKRGDLLWRATPAAVEAQELHAITATAASSVN